ncbi:MAG: thioredoxin family protein [Peptostreptococcales bacterium]
MIGNRRKGLIRMIILIAILVVIIGIWIVKNHQRDNYNQEAITENPDFALESASLNLDKLKSYGLPIIIDFGADSCPPCKEMEPILRELHAEYQGKVIIKYYDVWKDPSLAEGFPVQVVPTQFFFDQDGKPYNPLDTETMLIYTLKTTNEHVYTAHEGYMSKEMFLEIFKEMGVSVID